MQIPFDYYYRGQAARQGIGPPSVPQALSEIAASHERLWLLLSQDSLMDPQGVTLAWLDANMHLMQEWSYPGIRVKLYERSVR